MCKISEKILILVSWLLCFSNTGNAADNPFEGSWYSKPLNSEQYGENFAQLEISKDGSIAYRVFVISNSDKNNQKAEKFLEIPGSWRAVNNSFTGSLSEGRVELRFKKGEKGSIQVEEVGNGISAVTTFLSEADAPWSKLIPSK